MVDFLHFQPIYSSASVKKKNQTINTVTVKILNYIPEIIQVIEPQLCIVDVVTTMI